MTPITAPAPDNVPMARPAPLRPRLPPCRGDRKAWAKLNEEFERMVDEKEARIPYAEPVITPPAPAPDVPPPYDHKPAYDWAEWMVNREGGQLTRYRWALVEAYMAGREAMRRERDERPLPPEYQNQYADVGI